MNALKVMEFMKELLLIDSPTGYTKAVIDFYEKEVKALGYETIHTNKGNLIVRCLVSVIIQRHYVPTLIL